MALTPDICRELGSRAWRRPYPGAAVRTQGAAETVRLARHIRRGEGAMNAVDVLRARAEAAAALYAAGEGHLLVLVDWLQLDADLAGLVAEIGQDEVQAIMADAFMAVRPELWADDAMLEETRSDDVAI